MVPEVEGSLDDLYAATKVAVAPVFEGTGLSIKTLEGLAMGRAGYGWAKAPPEAIVEARR